MKQIIELSVNYERYTFCEMTQKDTHSVKFKEFKLLD